MEMMQVLAERERLEMERRRLLEEKRVAEEEERRRAEKDAAEARALAEQAVRKVPRPSAACKGGRCAWQRGWKGAGSCAEAAAAA